MEFSFGDLGVSGGDGQGAGSDAIRFLKAFGVGARRAGVGGQAGDGAQKIGADLCA